MDSRSSWSTLLQVSLVSNGLVQNMKRPFTQNQVCWINETSRTCRMVGPQRLGLSTPLQKTWYRKDHLCFSNKKLLNNIFKSVLTDWSLVWIKLLCFLHCGGFVDCGIMVRVAAIGLRIFCIILERNKRFATWGLVYGMYWNRKFFMKYALNSNLQANNHKDSKLKS